MYVEVEVVTPCAQIDTFVLVAGFKKDSESKEESIPLISVYPPDKKKGEKRPGSAIPSTFAAEFDAQYGMDGPSRQTDSGIILMTGDLPPEYPVSKTR